MTYRPVDRSTKAAEWSRALYERSIDGVDTFSAADVTLLLALILKIELFAEAFWNCGLESVAGRRVHAAACARWCQDSQTFLRSRSNAASTRAYMHVRTNIVIRIM